jgi:flagellar motor switch protein FliM
MSDPVLSQDEIDRVFNSLREGEKKEAIKKRAIPYDFRRPDRIAKDQLRSIHSLHENFVRSLASSLSAYLRAFATVNLISVEQLSYSEVVTSLTFPTCVLSLDITPYKGKALLETSHSVIFPIIEMLLGGKTKRTATIDRETTQIERSILDGIWRIVLQDLKTAWQSVAPIEFLADDYKNGPQVFQYFPANEAMIAVSMEVRLGAHSGLMNIFIPSIVIKMLRQKDLQKVHRHQASDTDQARMLKLVRTANTNLEVRLNGPRMLLKNLIKLEAGDVLSFDYPLAREVDLHINGMHKFGGHIVAAGNKRAFQIKSEHKLPQ